MAMLAGTTVPPSLFFGFKADSGDQVVTDELRSTVISAYEKALERGLSPANALCEILGWASEEFTRLCENSKPGC